MTTVDQLTQDVAAAQAEIAKLREALYKIGRGVSSQAEASLIADEALSSPSTALQEQETPHTAGGYYIRELKSTTKDEI